MNDYSRMLERDYKFKVVTRLSVEDVIAFYLAEARFPTAGEVDGIAFFGIDKYLDISQRVKKIQVPKTLKGDLEKLLAAKAQFTREVTNHFKNLLEDLKRVGIFTPRKKKP